MFPGVYILFGFRPIFWGKNCQFTYHHDTPPGRDSSASLASTGSRSARKQELAEATSLGLIWVFPKIGGTPKWMVYHEKLIKMDDLGVPLFSETSIYRFFRQAMIQFPLVSLFFLPDM